MIEQQTILWFQDSVKLRSPERKWGEVDMLTDKLIDLIGHPDFRHQIIRPEDCMKSLTEQLSRAECDFSSVIDLAGFRHMTEQLLIDNLPLVFGKFHLSRVRNVTSPRLDGCGHLLSLSAQEIQPILTHVDLSRPLIIDDVGWSGRTSLETARLLGVISPTFGFLAVNGGDFGEGRPGASGLLTEQGARVFAGQIVQTPRDDGFHLSDFCDHPLINEPEVFSAIVRVQQLREALSACNESDKKGLEAEIKAVLMDNSTVFFPNAKSSEEMKRFQTEGRFISQGGIPKNSLFDINPPNWLMPSFSRRVRSDMLIRNQSQIIETLTALREVLDIWRFL